MKHREAVQFLADYRRASGLAGALVKVRTYWWAVNVQLRDGSNRTVETIYDAGAALRELARQSQQ